MRTQQHLQWAFVAFCLGALAFLFYRDQQQEKQITILMARAGTTKLGTSRPGHDPYLKNQVKNRIIKGYPEIQACYQNYLKADPPVTDGDLKLDWQIDTDGEVIEPGIVLSAFQDPALHACLIGHTFPSIIATTTPRARWARLRRSPTSGCYSPPDC